MNKISITHYEKLHDIFERVEPQKMPGKIQKIIDYLESGHNDFKEMSTVDFDLSDSIDLLHQLKNTFLSSLKRTRRSILITKSDPNYEVNLYPILELLESNAMLKGDLEELKMTMVILINKNNISEFKESFRFLDSLTLSLF